MIWILSLFPAFRNLQAQARSTETAEDALRDEIRGHEASISELEITQTTMESERIRRIAAETVAAERREEIGRLLTQNRELREDLSRVSAERIRSVDAINLKLMEQRTPEVAPDMTKYSATEKLKTQLMSDVRMKHQAIDMAVLQKLHPKFAPRVTINATQTEAQAEEATA